MDVHVPQSWDEEAARGVEQVRILRYPDLVSRADGRDAIARNKNGLVATERSIDHVDDGDSSDSQGRGPSVQSVSSRQAMPNRIFITVTS